MCVQSATLLTDQFNMDPDHKSGFGSHERRRPWSVVRIADTTTGKQANLFFEFPWQPPWSRGPQRDFASNRIYLSHGVTKRPHYCRVFSFLVKRMSFYDFLQSYVTQIYHTYTQMTQTGSRMTFVCHILSPTITAYKFLDMCKKITGIWVLAKNLHHIHSQQSRCNNSKSHLSDHKKSLERPP